MRRHLVVFLAGFLLSGPAGYAGILLPPSEAEKNFNRLIEVRTILKNLETQKDIMPLPFVILQGQLESQLTAISLSTQVEVTRDFFWCGIQALIRELQHLEEKARAQSSGSSPSFDVIHGDASLQLPAGKEALIQGIERAIRILQEVLTSLLAAAKPPFPANRPLPLPPAPNGGCAVQIFSGSGMADTLFTRSVEIRQFESLSLAAKAAPSGQGAGFNWSLLPLPGLARKVIPQGAPEIEGGSPNVEAEELGSPSNDARAAGARPFARIEGIKLKGDAGTADPAGLVNSRARFHANRPGSYQIVVQYSVPNAGSCRAILRVDVSVR